MILIVAHEKDAHSKRIAHYLEQRRVEYLLVDFHDFPKNLQFCFLKSNKHHSILLDYHGKSVCMEDVVSVWYRRPRPPHIQGISNDSLKDYVFNESLVALESLPKLTKSFWISDPDAVKIASRKPYQLCIATDVGLSVPSSVIGNHINAVKEFAESSLKSIAAKPLGKAYFYTDNVRGPVGTYTQQLTPEKVREKMSQIQNCPLIFQEYVEKEFELRVTVVGEMVYACAIYSQASKRTSVDWRRYDVHNVPHKSYQLPKDVESKCLVLVKRLGLDFGCIDMIVTPEGNYVFLEINPVGQWLWIEELTGLPITESLASLLQQPPRR